MMDEMLVVPDETKQNKPARYHDRKLGGFTFTTGRISLLQLEHMLNTTLPGYSTVRWLRL